LAQFFSPALAQAAFVVLPISSVTTGAINNAVHQTNIQSTICNVGWRQKNLPSEALLNATMKKQIQQSYSIYKTAKLSTLSENLLIPVELGGNATSVANMWPLTKTGEFGAVVKNSFGQYLNKLVCGNKVSLAEAQFAMATNWYAAYQKYFLKVPVTSAVKLNPPILAVTLDATRNQWNIIGDTNQPNVGKLLWEFLVSLDGKPWKKAYVGSKNYINLRFLQSATTHIFFVKAAVANEYGASGFSVITQTKLQSATP
jgi:hypothetical protein